jgi:4-aminobutyrate aminotransferase-like enzyme
MFTKISQKSLKVSKAATAVSSRAVAKRSFAASARTQAYLDTDKKHVAFYYPVPELVVERGERIYLWDIEGNRYYDMLGGFASLS